MIYVLLNELGELVVADSSKSRVYAHCFKHLLPMRMRYTLNEYDNRRFTKGPVEKIESFGLQTVYEDAYKYARKGYLEQQSIPGKQPSTWDKTFRSGKTRLRKALGVKGHNLENSVFHRGINDGWNIMSPLVF